MSIEPIARSQRPTAISQQPNYELTSTHRINAQVIRDDDGCHQHRRTNIANEHTEGYRRRQVELRADSLNGPGVLIPTPQDGSYGLGVSLQSIDRVRDQLLASSTWEARSGLGAADEESRLLSALENLFPANSTGSLGDVINEFWNAWSDLSNNPETWAYGKRCWPAGAP